MGIFAADGCCKLVIKGHWSFAFVFYSLVEAQNYLFLFSNFPVQPFIFLWFSNAGHQESVLIMGGDLLINYDIKL